VVVKTAGLPVVELLQFACARCDPADLTRWRPQTPDAVHPNTPGHRIAADALTECIAAQGYLD
jgi:lysophospholipase L1-like esterase